MKRIHIIGLLFLIAGLISYYFVGEEPYTTVAGITAGSGFGLLLFGSKITRKFRN